MSVNIVAPSAGESVTEVEVSKWNVNEGDFVNKDQIIGEIETEKASLEIRSPENGKVHIQVKEGTIVSPGDIIASVDESVQNSQATTKTIEKNLEKKIEVENEKPILTTQTSNHSTTTPSPVSEKQPVALEAGLQSHLDTADNLSFHASPAIRKIIMENNLDINQITKLAKANNGNQISLKNIQDLMQAKTSSTIPSTKTNKNIVEPFLNAQDDRSNTSKKISRIRQTIATRLVAAQHSAALLTTFNEIDMFEVIKIRKKYKEIFKKKHEIGLGFMSFFVKAACAAIKDFPMINSQMNDDQIIEPNYVDLGIAVSTPRGLVVPIIRNAESKNFKAIENNIVEFSNLAKANNISMDMLTGGTFTITNGGTFGSMLSTPIVNYPQSAILGMHNIIERPVVKDGEIVIRPIMYVALTYDHRLIDGSVSVRFLYRIKELIEDPHRLLIGV